MIKSTAQIRQTFLDFFYKKGHKIIASSSLVPHDDPTLLFTNSGIVQFKKIFLGQDKRNYVRATTSQRCVRAGGKHNDLENVGYTTRHHTFFEMLGNFSFGDYFKKEAIAYAWELLTSKQWFNLSSKKLWITIYETDDESFKIWNNIIGVPSNRIIRIGDNKGSPYASDNFWQMGDVGPCGPCTEIFYDHGDSIWGGPPGSAESHGNRYTEIWNIVFMQFNRQQDGNMQLLPKPSIDTGMGLERIAAVLQDVNSNYQIDLFSKLIEYIAETIDVNNHLTNTSLFVVADHIRSCAFLIADGVIPSNENRGYVLRRIIRRAIRHGKILGVRESFFYKLVTPLIQVMGIEAENLKHKKIFIENLLKREEEQFAKTLERGLLQLDKTIANLKNDTLDGETVFRLYDTFGIPIDMITDVCHEHNLNIDEVNFNAALEKQRQQARKVHKFKFNNKMLSTDIVSNFKGYEQFDTKSVVQAIFVNYELVNQIDVGTKAIIILNKTPFYAESGGQIGDIGVLIGDNIEFNISDTQSYNKTIYHIGQLTKGKLCVGNHVFLQIDKIRRQLICCNHSATHLLHAALYQFLGIHVIQKGSLVTDNYLRFDFFHFNSITLQEIYQIESIVNSQIRRNCIIKADIMDIDAALNKGAKAFFEHKYTKSVRVITINDFSIELCGGTHTKRTGDIGLFLIRSQCSIGSNIRRIEAITGENALIQVNNQNKQLHDIAYLIKSNNTNNLKEKVHELLERKRFVDKELKKMRNLQIIKESDSLIDQLIDVKGTKLLVSTLKNFESKMLRFMINRLKHQLGSAIILLSTIINGKVLLIAGITPDLIDRIKANDLIDRLVNLLECKSIGNADIAQINGINQQILIGLSSTVYNLVYNQL
ncbi:alanine--tRNA ligase [Pantoea sp. Mhis]|uniref:alanine--tRNA ligase n=1 Tax=Pantoea sp. Mhis TaxID=2576759 RepID=UPI00135966DC|nr:alanine--tRNA ligase [Pantoea sp. Mhis]MXP56707.1 alanine--tRNA ligase [Pantoea sp. Mhis]